MGEAGAMQRAAGETPTAVAEPAVDADRRRRRQSTRPGADVARALSARFVVHAPSPRPRQQPGTTRGCKARRPADAASRAARRG